MVVWAFWHKTPPDYIEIILVWDHPSASMIWVYMHIFQGTLMWQEKRDISQPLTLKISPAAFPVCSVMHCQPPFIPTSRATAGPAHTAAATGSMFQPAPASQCSLKEALGEPGCFGAPLRIKTHKTFFYIICHTA